VNTVSKGARVGRAIAQEAHQDGSYHWHKQRQNGIGGSDAAIILGYDSFGVDRKKLWRRKTGQEEVFAGNTATRYGSLLEPYLFEKLQFRGAADASMRVFEDATLVENQLVHPEHSWMRANTDGFIAPHGVDAPTAGIEIKTSKYGFDGVKTRHNAQMQHYMGVTGIQNWLYVYFEVPFDREIAMEFKGRFLHPDEEDEYWSWVIDQGTIEVEEVEADPGYIRDLMEVEEDFWTCVQEGKEPEVRRTEGEVEVEDATLASNIDRYAELKEKVDADYNPHFSSQELKEKEDELETLKDQIKDRAEVIRQKEGGKYIFVEGDHGEHKLTWCNTYHRIYPADVEVEVEERPF